MSIRKKVIIFLLAMAATLLLELAHLVNLETKRTRATMERGIRTRSDSIDRIIRSEGASLESTAATFARQFAGRDLRSPESAAAVLDKVEPFLRLSGIHAFWVFGEDLAPVVERKYDPQLALPPRTFSPASLRQIVARNYSRHFFLGSDPSVLELQAAPIWGADAAARQRVPKGFLIAARLWDREYLRRLSGHSGCKLALTMAGAGYQKVPAGDKAGSDLQFSKELQDSQGQTVAVVSGTIGIPLQQNLLQTNRRLFFLFGSFGLLILAVSAVFFFVWIARPLGILTRSLDQQDRSIIQKLMKQKSEFGYLSQLIFRFFRQKEELLLEIGDRKKMEQSLKVKEEKYRNLIENQGEGVVVLDANEFFIFSNPAAEKMFAVFPERLIGYNLSEFVAPDQFQIVEEQTRLRSTGRKTSYEMEITRADGERRWILVNAMPQFEADNVFSSFEVFVDITDRKNAEAAMMESEAKFRKLTEAIPSGIFILQKEKFRYVNSYLEYLTGFKREEFFGMHYLDIVHSEFRSVVADLSRQLWTSRTGQKEPFRLEMKILTRDGHERWVDYTIDLIDFFKEKAILGSIYDITDRKRMEEEIIKTQKMESVSQLAGGIAHDFNNYLTAIMGNISLARVMVGKQPKLVKILNKAENATIRARDLSQQLLTFSRGGDPVKEVMDLGPLVEETVGFVLSGSSVKADIFIDKRLWPVEIDESQISQVFNNLIINAVDAMAQAGTITIRVENEKFPAQQVLANAPANENPDSTKRYIKITLQDQGKGIEQKNLPKVFDPYFTTKKGGIGLGLAVVYSIVSKHGGSIHVQSQVGVGTTFYIWLPAAEGRLEKGAIAKKEIVHGTGRVLLMDDEDFVREVAAEMLEHLGYEVTVACDGDETLRIYREAKDNGNPFAAVIMDLTIPGKMGGKETIRQLLEIDPHVRAIVSSGYSNDPVMADFRRFGFKGIVVKPYKMETLSESLGSVIRENGIG